MKAIVIAGTQSGVGKTTVAAGIMGALIRRGYTVQPFKVGPDYIDPSYHTAVCGRPCRNLDSWLLEPHVIRELFDRAMAGKDLAVIEGVMGLYDGARGEDDEGSTAQLAKLLGLPVVLVMDASKSSRSLGAALLGFRAFDPELKLAGVILNGIAGEMHLELAKPALAQAGVPCLGYLPGRKDLTLPERHLGLIPTAEGTVEPEYYRRLADQAEVTVDLDRLLTIASQALSSSREPSRVFPTAPISRRVALAVAMDKAFSFYYPDSLDLLTAWGAEIVPFSPLHDSALPEQVGGVYLGGGFPELYAQGLSENTGMRLSLRRAAEMGQPIYAECGGLMYLSEGMEDMSDHYYPMVGIVPRRCYLKGSQLSLGYRTVRAVADNPLLCAGESVRGHEFHLSSLQEPSPGSPSWSTAYEVLEQPGRVEGFRYRNVLASYIHLHLGSKAGLASRFVESCVRWAAQERDE